MKLESGQTTVLDLAYSPKEAALYFDYVIPCYVMISGGPFRLDMDSIPCEHLTPEPLFRENLRPQISLELLRVQTYDKSKSIGYPIQLSRMRRLDTDPVGFEKRPDSGKRCESTATPSIWLNKCEIFR